jgi:hypothetical protein
VLNESRWTAPHSECPHPERWSAPDSTAAEVEVSEFLGALCVALRPKRVLETGAYLGYTARAMGRALVGFGELHSLEKDPARWRAARAATQGLPVTVHLVDSQEFEPDGPLDLIFFDSHIGMRYQEVLRFRQFASRRCVWALHDTMHPQVAGYLDDLQADGIVRSVTNLPTPRGLALGRYAV